MAGRVAVTLVRADGGESVLRGRQGEREHGLNDYHGGRRSREVPGVDRLLVHGWLRGLRDVGGGGAEQRHNETRECVVVLMTPVSGVLYRASAPDRRRIDRSSRPEEGCFFIDRFFRRFSELRTPRQSLQLGDSESRANSGPGR